MQQKSCSGEQNRRVGVTKEKHKEIIGLSNESTTGLEVFCKSDQEREWKQVGGERGWKLLGEAPSLEASDFLQEDMLTQSYRTLKEDKENHS